MRGAFPAPRAYHGFVAALGKLYLFGGWSGLGAAAARPIYRKKNPNSNCHWPHRLQGGSDRPSCGAGRPAPTSRELKHSSPGRRRSLSNAVASAPRGQPQPGSRGPQHPLLISRRRCRGLQRPARVRPGRALLDRPQRQLHPRRAAAAPGPLGLRGRRRRRRRPALRLRRLERRP